MLRRLILQDFVIVERLEFDFEAGLTVLTGETGAGKSILIDALQLALGQRADAGVVREGCAKADISAEFDQPSTLNAWLEEAGFEPEDGDAPSLLLRRVVDAKGKSRAWINGSPATLTQLGEVAHHLVDIHGQHAWQSLTRPEAVRALLDAHAGVDASALVQAHRTWTQAQQRLERAQQQQSSGEQERERLEWQVQEMDRLAPQDGEWDELSQEHQRLSHGQSLLAAAQQAAQVLDEASPSAVELLQSAISSLEQVLAHDARLEPMVAELHSSLVQVQDAARDLSHYAQSTDLDPERLQALDERMSLWMGLARRFRQSPPELPQVHARWRDELQALASSSDVDALEKAVNSAKAALLKTAKAVSQQRQAAVPVLEHTVTQLMQDLGMVGGRLEVALLAQESPQSYGLESVELRVAGHAGSTPRALNKVASGGELSRLALAVAVAGCKLPSGKSQASPASQTVPLSTSPKDQPVILIFDEIDAGIGGAVADTVGQLMQRLGQQAQVLAVTHLAQVAAHAHHHCVVSKVPSSDGQRTVSHMRAIAGPNRTHEIARMLSGELSPASILHAQTLLERAQS